MVLIDHYVFALFGVQFMVVNSVSGYLFIDSAIGMAFIVFGVEKTSVVHIPRG